MDRCNNALYSERRVTGGSRSGSLRFSLSQIIKRDYPNRCRVLNHLVIFRQKRRPVPVCRGSELWENRLPIGRPGAHASKRFWFESGCMIEHNTRIKKFDLLEWADANEEYSRCLYVSRETNSQIDTSYYTIPNVQNVGGTWSLIWEILCMILRDDAVSYLMAPPVSPMILHRRFEDRWTCRQNVILTKFEGS